MPDRKVVVREDRKWERVVFAEVLVPDTVNNYGDYTTADAIVEFAYEFARRGYGLDVNHDNNDVSGTGYYVVESFIARAGDPDFIEGSWVVGVKIVDDDIWAQVLAGDLNGFSYEALVEFTPVVLEVEAGVQVAGVTEPHPEDGHTHTFLLILDEKSNPQAGATSETNGHSHRIVSHTTTEVAEGHNHRYQVV